MDHGQLCLLPTSRCWLEGELGLAELSNNSNRNRSRVETGPSSTPGARRNPCDLNEGTVNSIPTRPLRSRESLKPSGKCVSPVIGLQTQIHSYNTKLTLNHLRNDLIPSTAKFLLTLHVKTTWPAPARR